MHSHGSKALSAGYSVVFVLLLLLFFVCVQTRLVRPGKILVIPILVETVAYAARVPPDLFAIAQTDLQESAATSIAPNLHVWKSGTVAQGET